MSLPGFGNKGFLCNFCRAILILLLITISLTQSSCSRKITAGAGINSPTPSPSPEKLIFYSVADVETAGYPCDDGTRVVFSSNAGGGNSGENNGFSQIYLYEKASDKVTLITTDHNNKAAGGNSTSACISGDGRFVVFESEASDLLIGDSNGVSDVFIFDVKNKKMEIVSRPKNGKESNGSSGCPSISRNGRFVAFSSRASNLVPGDTNRLKDVFIKNMVTGNVERVSVSSRGEQASAPEAMNASDDTSISADGRFVAFCSPAANLVPGDTNGYPDVFLRDRKLGSTTRISLDSLGHQADNFSQSPAISADGGFITFDSRATNLAPGDTGGHFNVFLRDVKRGITVIASRELTENRETTTPNART